MIIGMVLIIVAGYLADEHPNALANAAIPFLLLGLKRHLRGRAKSNRLEGSSYLPYFSGIWRQLLPGFELS